MKYDILLGFKRYLEEELTPNTAKTYFSGVKKVFDNYDLSSLGEIPKENILLELKKFGTKNQVSAAKNGLKKLHEYDNSLNLPTEQEFKSISAHKRNRVKSRGKVVDFDQMMRKTNAIRNKKMKYSYRLAAVSGLRVAELASLEPGDLLFSDGQITIHVRKGKGGKEGFVVCLEDDYLYKNLQEYIAGLGPDQRMFYSEGNMRKYAYKHGMQMHDFRRVFATLEKKELQDQGYSAEEANEIVQEQLRHTRFSTTKRYLQGRRIKSKKLKKEKPKKVDPVVVDNDRSNLDAMEKQEFYQLISEMDVRDLTPEEKQVIKDYMGDGYSEINDVLCQGKPASEDTLKKIDTLTECLERKELPRDEVVYRGLDHLSVLFGSGVDKMDIKEISKRYEGTFFISEGFSPMSIDKDISKGFTGNPTGVLMEISVPAKMKGIFLGAVGRHKESEILFQRRSIYKINHIKSDSSNIIVQASLVHQAKRKEK